MRPPIVRAFRRAGFGALLLAAALVACSDGPTGPPPVDRVRVEPGAPAVVVGGELTLVAVLHDVDGNVLADRVVEWRSEAPETAAVSGGRVAGHRVGRAVIVATSEGVTGRATVIVRPPPVAGISVVPSVVELLVGDSARLTVTLLDAASAAITDRRASANHADARVADLNADGWVVARAAGLSTITFVAEDARTEVPVRVRERPATQIRPVQRRLQLEPDARGFAQAATYTSEGRVVALVPASAYASSDPSVLALEGNAYVAKATGTAEIRIAHDGLTARIPVSVTAPPPSAFQIDVRWVGAPHAGAAAALEVAVAHWRRVILNDLPDMRVTLPDSACLDELPAVDELVDDLLLWVRVAPMDGPGGVAGAAGPCAVRGASGLPMAGVVLLDEVDVNAMAANPYGLQRLVLHEIGHVLGIGTLWEERGHLDVALPGDPRFVGAAARLAAGDMGFPGDEARGVAVESEGSEGTAGGHWREAAYHEELMTGWIELLLGAPLSAVTIGSLADLGYQVNPAAAEQIFIRLALPSAGGATPQVVAPGGSSPSVRDTVRRPRFRVDAHGTHALPP